MMSVTPSSSKPPDPSWDVYVSFIGDKTNDKFMNYLFAGLERNGIVTFRQLPKRGENIPNVVMLKAIQRSRIFMVILSQGYVSSAYCLDELSAIVHYRNTIDHNFFPIFYQLDPSNVQKRIETLAKAFARPEEQFETSVDQRMQRWIAALTEATNSSDRILHGDANGSMGILKFIEEVLDVVCTRLNIPRNMLRMDSCVEMMTDFLHLGTSDIYIVGMSCMDEILKETLIGVVYSQIYDGFERTSLIPNIREVSKVPNGLVHLQEQLLRDIVGMNKVNINNADEGINLIEEAIQGKRVLIVLDNVDDLKQLHSLVGNSKCFGPGSRVIAISRDKQLRTELEAHGKHKVEDLHDWKSPQLFIWRASMMAHPAEDFSDKKNHYLQLKNKGHDYEVKFNPDANLDLSAAEAFSDEDDAYYLRPIKFPSAIKAKNNLFSATIPLVGEPQHTVGGAVLRMDESPPSVAGPRIKDSDPEHRDDSRKRKQTQQMRVSPGVRLEGPLDDGYKWRKYGQKEVLNAKYPRGYYTCTYRNVQGCPARKKVQRSDEDPTVFEITYRGRHTCVQASHINPPPTSPEKQEQNNKH